MFDLTAPDLTMKCMEIDYFSKEEYIADQNDSTMAIPCEFNIKKLNAKLTLLPKNVSTNLKTLQSEQQFIF